MIVKEIVGVKIIVPVEFPPAAVEAVGSCLGHNVRARTSAVSILGRHVQGQLLEFLHCVFDRLVDSAAAQPFVRGTVNQEAVEVLAQTVHHRIRAIFGNYATDVHRTRRHLNQVVDVATIQWQVRNLGRVNDVGQL